MIATGTTDNDPIRPSHPTAILARRGDLIGLFAVGDALDQLVRGA